MKNLSDILYHLGEDNSQYFDAIVPPVIQSSNFQFRDLTSFRKAILDESSNTIYTRGNNPTVAILRKKMAALENAEDSIVFASGSAAIAAAVIGNVANGDHIVAIKAPYSWSYSLMTKFLTRFGVTTTFVDAADVSEIEKAIQPNTKILFLESPNSLTFELQDLHACAEIAKKHGLVSIIDNSYCTPLYQRPIEMGIDIVVHSGSKYLNGHSDVVVGVLCGKSEMVKKIFHSEFMTLGAIISPHDANLVIRGLRTLPLRLERSEKTVQKVIAFLEKHPKIEKILYPFHPSHPQYELAKKQMQGANGLFSIQLKADSLQAAERFFYALKHFPFAVSWGGHESLIFPTCALYGIEGKPNPPLPYTFCRLYIGLEDADFLIEDLSQALAKI